MEVWLLNAAHMKAVPGRKSDVRDAEWIAQLLEHGLLRPSFVPPAADGEPGRGFGGPVVAVVKLGFEGGPERLSGSVIPAHPGPTDRLEQAETGAQFGDLVGGVLGDPRSAWKMTLSGSVPRSTTAMVSAWSTRSARR